VSYVAAVLALAAEYAGQLPPVIATPLPVPSDLPPVNPGPPPALTVETLAAGTPAATTLAPTTLAPTTPATTGPPAAAAATTLAAGPPTGPATTSSSTSPSSSAATSSSSAPSSSAGPMTSVTPGTSSGPVTSSSSGSTSSSSGTPTTSSSPPPSSTSVCPVDPETLKPVTIDVVDETGDPAKGSGAVEDIRAAHLTLGALTASTATDASAIEYPAALQEQARQMATDIGQTQLLLPSGSVAVITLVLGRFDAGPLLDALHHAAAAPVCPGE
jgi:hypothetical protein